MSCQRNTLGVASLDARSLDDELEPCRLGMRRKPRARGGQHAPHLFRIDHLERMSEAGATLLLHLDDDEPTATPEDEVELVSASASIRLEEAIAADPIVPEGAALAAIHAAS